MSEANGGGEKPAYQVDAVVPIQTESGQSAGLVLGHPTRPNVSTLEKIIDASNQLGIPTDKLSPIIGAASVAGASGERPKGNATSGYNGREWSATWVPEGDKPVTEADKYRFL